MDGKSQNIVNDKIEQLKAILPEAVTEGKIDWEKLRITLGDDVNVSDERYVLNWAGKSDAFRALQAPTTATLAPAEDESVNFKETKNIFIEGENLETLKVLQKAYYGKIKMIYIDPPYNTGNDSFVYPDRFAESREEYLKRINDKDEEGLLMREGQFRKNSKDSGHYHSNWLSMMYPRLYLARNLLHVEGAMLVSIGDDELAGLTMMMNEIFGEENQIGIFVWKSRAKPTNAGNAKFRPQKVAEYVLAYGRKPADEILLNVDSAKKRTYPHEDKEGQYRTTTILTSNRGMFRRETMRFEAGGYKPDEDTRWKAGRSLIEDLFQRNRILFNEDGIPLEKKYKHEEDDPLYPIYTFMEPDLTGTAETGKSELNELVGNQHGLDTVKPVSLMKYFCSTFTNPGDQVLDFFAGSGTIGQAILELNTEETPSRSIILVQFPEPYDKKSEAFKAGYKTIAALAKNRLQKVIKKLINENPMFAEQNQDLGFKVFKLKHSNFKLWRGDGIENGEELEKQLDLLADPVKPEALEKYMLFELLLKSGYALTTKIEKRAVGKSHYYLVDDDLVIALSHLSEAVVQDILEATPQQVICLDSLFANDDPLKTNTKLQFKDAEIAFHSI
jgi:adenine-specific DNA-methyltransferase